MFDTKYDNIEYFYVGGEIIMLYTNKSSAIKHKLRNIKDLKKRKQ